MKALKIKLEKAAIKVVAGGIITIAWRLPCRTRRDTRLLTMPVAEIDVRIRRIGWSNPSKEIRNISGCVVIRHCTALEESKRTAAVELTALKKCEDRVVGGGARGNLTVRVRLIVNNGRVRVGAD